MLDHGTGTGVLAIFAKHLGAKEVIAVDIDEKSVENAKENAALNNETIEVELCKSILETDRSFDLILANIHRNILLANMAAYAHSLEKGGELWLSGFYESDIEALTREAALYSLQPIQILSSGDWRLVRLLR